MQVDRGRAKLAPVRAITEIEISTNFATCPLPGVRQSLVYKTTSSSRLRKGKSRLGVPIARGCVETIKCLGNTDQGPDVSRREERDRGMPQPQASTLLGVGGGGGGGGGVGGGGVNFKPK